MTMKPLNLQEFAEQLRLEGNEFADEILELCTLEDDVAEPYGDLCDDIASYVPDALKEKPDRGVEWLGDRSNELKEIEAELDKDGRTGDTDDQIKAMLCTLENIRLALGLPDTATDEDLETAVQELVDAAPPKLEYDL